MLFLGRYRPRDARRETRTARSCCSSLHRTATSGRRNPKKGCSIDGTTALSMRPPWLLFTSAAATLLDLEEADTVCKTKTAASFQRHAHHLPTKWTARYSRAAAPGRPGRYLELWGRFGLLNNRLRCLANAVGFAARADASLVLSGPLGAVRGCRSRFGLVDSIANRRRRDRGPGPRLAALRVLR